MKNNFWFYAGLGIDVLTLLISLSSALMMDSGSALKGMDGPIDSSMSGMTDFGRLLAWLIPLILFALICAALWLKSRDKMLAANILLWIPALPMLAGIVLWGGLAVLFILFGK